MSQNPFQTDANPYASPVPTYEVPPAMAVSGQLNIASQNRRFLNLILDNIILWVVGNGVGLVLGFAYGMSLGGRPATPDDMFTLQVASMFVGIVVTLIYFIAFETAFQRSPAKFITSTMVVREDGGRPSFGQIAGRSLARYIPFEAFSFLGNKGFPIGWHDSLSGTRVIKV